MAPSKRASTAAATKKSEATKESTVAATRKRGRPPTKKAAEPAEPAAAAVNVAQESDQKGTTVTEDTVKELDVPAKTDNEEKEQPVKRKRGRPAKNNGNDKKEEVKKVDSSVPKRGRGRPRKVVNE